MSHRLVERQDFTYEIVEDVAGRPLRVGGEMQLADKPNLNRRKYPESLWDRVLGAGKTQSRLKERRMLGLLDHPVDGKTKLEWPGPSHVMTHLEKRPSTRFPGTQAIYGVYECLPTPSGKVLEALLRSRIGIQVSSRGDGDLEEGIDGYSTVIPESYDLDTFDVVIDPSVNTDVRVIESKQDDCSCKLPQGKTTEAIVRAIHKIVEDEGRKLDRSCCSYYKQVLESALPSLGDSEAFLFADQALSNLNEYLEVTPVKKTDEQPVTEAQTSGNELQRLQAENARLRSELEEATKNQQAGVKTVEALIVQSRNYKMQYDHMNGQYASIKEKAELYDAAKTVIKDLRETVKELQGESEARMATEQFLAALLTKIDGAKRHAYAERLLANEPKSTRESLRPLLYRCGSKREVNEQLLAHKRAIGDRRNSRTLPPVNESGRRTAKISPASQLMETRGRVETGRVVERNGTNNEVRLGGQPLSEQVAFAKKVIKSSRS